LTDLEAVLGGRSFTGKSAMRVAQTKTH